MSLTSAAMSVTVFLPMLCAGKDVHNLRIRRSDGLCGKRSKSDVALLGGQSRRASSLTTVVGCHFPPRAAGILRLDSSSLMARGVVCPVALSSLMVGARLLAYKSAALLFDAAPWPPRLRGAGLGPSTEPIALSSCAHIGSLMPAQRACWSELCDLFQRQPIVCSESGASAEIQSRAVDGHPV